MKLSARIWFVIALGLIIAVGGSILLSKVTTATPSPLTLPTGRIVYFAPSSFFAPEDMPDSSATLAANGVGVVHDFRQLKTVVGTSEADAIILHQLTVPEVDKAWIITQYRNGVIVGAINLEMHELADLVDDQTIMESPWTEGWYRKPYYSYVGAYPDKDLRHAAPTGASPVFVGTAMRGTDNLAPDMKSFLFALRLALKSRH